MLRSSCGAVLMIVVGLASSAEATRLFAIHRDSGVESLVEVDPATGVSRSSVPLPSAAYHGMAGRRGDPRSLYTVWGTDPSVARVSRIDVDSGQITDLHSFTSAQLGFTTDYLQFDAISFASDAPVAIVSGAAVTLVPTPVITLFAFELDVQSGVLSGLQLVGDEGLSDLTHAADGTLFTDYAASAGSFRLATLDPATGSVTDVGPMCCGIRAMDVDPATDRLLVFDEVGTLHHISQEDAANLGSVVTGLALPVGQAGGVIAMAFVPEPATGALLGLALVALGLARRRPAPRQVRSSRSRAS